MRTQPILEHGDRPGVNDDFRDNDRGSENFFAFHDYNPDYFVVTGENFPGRVGSSAASIRSGVTIPRELNSGVTGMQVSINAKVNQTILVRILCAAYSKIKVTFPVRCHCHRKRRSCTRCTALWKIQSCHTRL